MTQTRDYERARSRAKAKYGFYVHAVVYGAVIGFLLLINLLTSPGVWWFIWPLLGWGVFLALHGGVVFLMGDRETILEALTEQELHHAGTGKHDDHN